MAKEYTDADDALLSALGVEAQVSKKQGRTPREERIIAGFKDIQCFVSQYNRLPRHGEECDIFERLYSIRLDGLRERAECREFVEDLDYQGLLEHDAPAVLPDSDVDDDELLSQLGVESDGPDDITVLRHVRSTADKRVAEEIANRQVCKDFEKIKELFMALQRDIESGVRITRSIHKEVGFLKTDIKPGEFFILGGQTVYIAEIGEFFKGSKGHNDARLRAIYSNGTESNILLRSLQRALYKDETSRRVSENDAGPLFGSDHSTDDFETGTIYVLRSLSDNPTVSENRSLIHKIGVTGGDVKKRIAHAKADATFLLADVEIVATYQLFNINRIKLEKLLHRIFDAARLDIQLEDRFGRPFIPREWFLVPLFVIDSAVEKIKDGTITQYIYDPHSVRLVEKKIF